MKKPSILISLVLSLWMLTGCAAMFSPKTQEVAIHTDDNADVFHINGGDSARNNRSVVFQKDKRPVQIVVSNNRYRDEQFIAMQYKMSSWHILSWFPGFLVGAPAIDYTSNSAYLYPSNLDLKFKRIPELGKANANGKKLKVASVTTEISNKNFFSVEHDYADWLVNPTLGKVVRMNTNEKYEFTEAVNNHLNDFLKGKGFEGENLGLGSKNNTLSLTGRLSEMRMHYFSTQISLDQVAYGDLKIEWEMRNSDGKVVGPKVFDVTSGQFIYPFPFDANSMLNNVIGDAMEKSLCLFLNDSVVASEINTAAKVVSPVSVNKRIKLNAAKKYVGNLQQAIKASVTIKGKDGHGSGFLVSPDGYIVTNYHVIDRVPDGKVVLNDKSVFDYDVVQYDKEIDLALIKIDASGLTPFKLQKSGGTEVGADIYTIGTPRSAELSQSLTKGIVSGIRTTENGSKLIQTDASINAGNSGGALVDPKGLVLGVVSSKLAGFGVEGVAFGIPVGEVFDKLKLEPAY